MAVKIRLARHGAKKYAYYRVVVADSRKPRDGKFIEAVGSYDPNHKPAKVEFVADRLEHWLKAGATPSETVGELIKRHKRAAATAKPA